MRVVSGWRCVWDFWVEEEEVLREVRGNWLLYRIGGLRAGDLILEVISSMDTEWNYKSLFLINIF